MNSDLRSAGLSAADMQTALDVSLPLEERWRLVEPYWEAARFTGYCRALDLSVSGIYGLPRIDGSTIGELDRRFKETLKPGHYTRVLKELCNIEVSLLDSEDSPMESDPEYFRSVFRIDRLVLPRLMTDLENMEKLSGIPIVSFDSYLEACSAILHIAASKGVIALKIALAYERPILFHRRERGEAEKGFYRLLKKRHIPEWVAPTLDPELPFQDFVLHHILKENVKLDLPVQVHTGLQEGSGNRIGDGSPSLLVDLFLEYPQVRFDLFHISYPYQHTAGALAKNFPNVFLDMCWAHIISPRASVDTLVEWIDLVPCNKIFAFGGDFKLPDGVYGHAVMAKRNVAQALGGLVRGGVCSSKEAEELAERLFRKNQQEFFRL
jgi:hypothetical protein